MQQPDCLWTFICDHFITDVTGKYSLIGVFDRIGAPAFPAMHKSLYVVAALSGEPNSTTDGLLDIWAPDGSLVLSTAESRLVFSAQGRTLFVNLIYDLQLPQAGVYSGTVEAGGRPAGTFTFEVYALMPPPATAPPTSG